MPAALDVIGRWIATEMLETASGFQKTQRAEQRLDRPRSIQARLGTCTSRALSLAFNLDQARGGWGGEEEEKEEGRREDGIRFS